MTYRLHNRNTRCDRFSNLKCIISKCFCNRSRSFSPCNYDPSISQGHQFYCHFADSFSRIRQDGTVEGIKPSKELPLHKMYYEKSDSIQAVIHVHSFYATMYTFLPHDNVKDIVPDYTPYLKMKVGTVGLVPYAKPGSEELFGYFREALPFSDAFLLAQHGPVVGGVSLMDAFYGLEELEESCRIAWTLDSGR